MQSRSIVRGYACIIASAVIFGCMPLLSKYIYADGVNSITLVLLRSALSLPILVVLALIRHERIRLPIKDAASVMAVGIVGCALTPLLLLSSYNYISGGTATVLHFVYPAVVLVLELILVRSRVKYGSVIGILLCIGGIALFYDPSEAISLTGSALALLSGVSNAVYIVLLSRLGSRGAGEYTFAFYASLSASAMLLVVCLASNSLALPTTIGGWLLCVLFSLLINVGALVLFQVGTFIIGGQKASILSTFEPITSLGVDYFAFGINAGTLSVVGSALIISASVLIAVLDGKEKKNEKQNLN